MVQLQRCLIAVFLLLALESGVRGQVFVRAPEQGPVSPPRDGPVRAQTGTAVIRGRVLAQNGQAVRRADVTLNGPTFVRRTSTSAAGRFEFAGLPAGSFSVTVQKAGFVGLAYGQRRPLEPGLPVQVREGQRVEGIDVVLPRGSVIVVRITDDVGEPVVGAQIQVHQYRYAPDGQRRLTGAPSGVFGQPATDDRGEFRVFGLMPGEYAISAQMRLQPRSAPILGDDDRESFAPTFFPGTQREDLAQPVSVGTGEETVAQFAMVPARFVRVSGTVHRSDGQPAAGAQLQIATRRGGGVYTHGAGPVAPDGTFSIAGVPPGDHFITVRPAPPPGVPMTVNTGEFASVPIAVGPGHLAGIRIVTSRGATVSGRVEFDGTSRPDLRVPLRVSLQQADPVEMSFGMPQSQDPADNGTVGGDGGFRIVGASGRVFVQTGASGWAVKSVMLDGRNVIDEPLELTGRTSVSGLVITLTDRLASVAGQVRDAHGTAVARSVVVVIPDDAPDTAAAGRLTRTLRPDPSDGRFLIRGIRPGRYLAAAVDWIEDGRQYAPEFQRELRRVARPFTVSESANVTLDLRLTPGL